MKATLNMCVFRRDLKFSRDDAFLISAVNLFHKVGAATLNAQSPYDLSRDTGTCNSIWLDDPSFRDDFLMETSSHRYSGALSLIVYWSAIMMTIYRFQGCRSISVKTFVSYKLFKGERVCRELARKLAARGNGIRINGLNYSIACCIFTCSLFALTHLW